MITPAQNSKQISTCRSEYVSKDVCTYMHATSRLFSWSIELLAFASRLFASKMLDHPLTSVCHSDPFFLASERSGRNRPLREAPCKHTYLHTRALSVQHSDPCALSALEPFFCDFSAARPRFVARLARSDSPQSRGPCPRADPSSPAAVAQR